MPSVTFIPPPIVFRDPGRDALVPILENAYRFADTLLTRVPELQMQQERLQLDQDRLRMDMQERAMRARQLEADLAYRQQRFDWERERAQRADQEAERAAFYKEYRPFLDPTSTIFQQYDALQRAHTTGEKAWRDALQRAQTALQQAAVRVTKRHEGDETTTSNAVVTFVPTSPPGQALMQRAADALARMQQGTASVDDYALVRVLAPYLPQAPQITVDDQLLARFGGLTNEQVAHLAQLDRTRLESFLNDARISRYLTPDQIAAWRRLLEFRPPELRMAEPPAAAEPLVALAQPPELLRPPAEIPSQAELGERVREPTGAMTAAAAATTAPATSAPAGSAPAAAATIAPAEPASAQTALSQTVQRAVRHEQITLDNQLAAVMSVLLQPRGWWHRTDALREAEALQQRLRSISTNTKLPEELRQFARDRSMMLEQAVLAHLNSSDPAGRFNAWAAAAQRRANSP